MVCDPNSAINIAMLDLSLRYGTEARAKRSPANTSVRTPRKVNKVPVKPGRGAHINAKKWKTMRSQPISQFAETVVLLRRATEANAQGRSATATRSGSLLQST